MTKENESLLLYKKITNNFSLIEKNYLCLGSYLISMEISLENKSKKEVVNPKIKNKIKEIERFLSEKE